MKIPKKIKIGGHIVKVDCSKELEGCNGKAISCKNVIEICKTVVQSQRESILLHEVFHFLNPTFDDGDRHAVMDSVVEQFYQVLVDNNMLR